MGSGSLAAMSVFESKYKEGLTVSEPVQQFLDLNMLAMYYYLPW